MGDTTAADRAEKEVDAMYQAVLDAGWDGEWFVRAYDAESKKLVPKNARKVRSLSNRRASALWQESV